MGSLKFVLRRDKCRADGTCPIFLRVTHRRRSRYVATGIYVDPKDWNEARQEVRRSHPLFKTYNARLKNLRLEAEATLLETGDLLRVKAELKGSSSRSLLELGRRHAETLLEAGRLWSYKQQRVMLNKLEAYRPDARLEDLTPEFVEGFQRFLESRLGNSTNTVRKNLQCLRRLVRYATKQGLLDPAHDPFLHITYPRETTPERRRLQPEEIRRLAELELPPPPAPLTRARDMFLLAFYAGGMRFGDVCALRIDNVQGLETERPWLRYRMLKTGRLVEIPLPPEAVAIIRRWEGPWRPYIFPVFRPNDLRDGVTMRRRISAVNALVNRQLKDLARMAGIERPESVSTHVARHSLADWARRRSGDLYAVSKLLGHANLKITERYLESFDRQAVERLADKLWSDNV